MKLFEIAVRAFCDVQADVTADAVYLYSQTEDNQISVLTAARQLLAEQRVRKILIAHSGPKSGYPGDAAWRSALHGMGVPASSIEGVDLQGESSLNTLIEANAMARHAKKRHYTHLYITASPFHQVRAFMTSVTAAHHHHPEINLYSHAGGPLPWLDSAAHSQGETTGTRRELIGAEYDRILRYQAQGDLVMDEDILVYLNQRDQRTQY
jgi:hypothetical protein